MIQRVGVGDMVTISPGFMGPLPLACGATVWTRTGTLGPGSAEVQRKK